MAALHWPDLFLHPLRVGAPPCPFNFERSNLGVGPYIFLCDPPKNGCFLAELVKIPPYGGSPPLNETLVGYPSPEPNLAQPDLNRRLADGSAADVHHITVMGQHAWLGPDRRPALLCAALCAPAAWCIYVWAARKPRRRPTGFESFLKAGGNAEAERSPADFGAFLRKARGPQAAADAGPGPGAAPEAAAGGPRAGDAAVAVLFGTEYGASKEVAELLCAQVRAAGAYWCGRRRSRETLGWG